MPYYKAVVDFSQEADGSLSSPAHAVHDLMLVTNAATFPNAPFSAAAFLALVVAWDNALSESLKGGTDRTTTKNNARAALEDALYKLGGYVNVVADGDKAIVELSAFPSYTTARVQSTGGVTFIPLNVRWEDGTVSGQQVLRWKGDGSHAYYGVQTCTGDPNVEASWSDRGAFTGGKAVLDGFTPGAKIWGRVRKLGTGGQYGAWSDPAQTMAK
jgi:hypothetical protein